MPFGYLTVCWIGRCLFLKLGIITSGILQSILSSFTRTRLEKFVRSRGRPQGMQYTDPCIWFNHILSTMASRSRTPANPRLLESLLPRVSRLLFFLSNAPLIVLLRADHLTYWAVIAGIMRAGYQCFTISPRNSPSAIAHLLETTGCELAFVSGDNGTQTLMQEALANMEEKVALIDMPDWKELYINDDTNFQTLPPFALHSLDTPCLMVHSSGTIMLQCC